MTKKNAFVHLFYDKKSVLRGSAMTILSSCCLEFMNHRALYCHSGRSQACRQVPAGGWVKLCCCTSQQLWYCDHLSVCRHGDLSLLAQEANVAEFTTCNAGMIHDLFRNARYARQLHRWGVRPETAFSCAYWFLFSPSEAVRNRFAPVETVLANSHSLNIGIQIRTFYGIGDNFTASEDSALACEDIKEAQAQLDSHFEYFECAEIIEETLRKVHGIQNVRWFLVSDSAKLRNCAATVYKDKLIGHRHQERHLEHIRLNADPADAVIDSVGDHLMLAMTDFIIGRFGSFGKLAALLHGRWHSYHRLPNHAPELTHERLKEVCTKPLTFDEMANVPPGVR